eukprot:EG_transcript_11029
MQPLGAELSEAVHRSADDPDIVGTAANLPGAPSRGTPMHALQAPMQPVPMKVKSPSPVEPASPLEDCPALPGWWACTGHSGCFLCPTLVLLGLSVGLFINRREPLVWWYPVLFAALAALAPFATWVLGALHAQHQLRRRRCPTATREAGFCPFGNIIHRTATNRCLTAFSQSFSSPKATRNRDDPLDFLRQDLAEWAGSADGWVVIDTTGIILWVNEAVKKYFGYEGDYLLQRNVRILMPQPYAAEHDFFIRKQIKTGVCRILGNPAGRPVPVANRKGEQSMVVLSINDHLDPHDMANYVFSGRMRFVLQDAALIKVRSKVAQGCDVVAVCKGMDAEPLARIVADGRGTIVYANAAASKLFGWGRKELVGRNVKCLMGLPHASKHDSYLQAYLERCHGAAGHAVPSSIVGSGRDVMALTKARRTIRIFLTVERIDQHSGDPLDCFFHATIVPVTEVDPSWSPTYCGSLRRSLAAAAGTLP